MAVSEPTANLSSASNQRKATIASINLTNMTYLNSIFYPFPDLPTEIHLKIWKLSKEPRLVMLRDSQRASHIAPASADSDDVHLYYSTHPYLYCYTPPPAILHTCRESRDEGLKLDGLAFSTPPRPFITYFYFPLDTLGLGFPAHKHSTEITSMRLSILDACEKATEVFSSSDCERLRFLAIMYGDEVPEEEISPVFQCKDWEDVRLLY
jgi:hypothetical protein